MGSELRGEKVNVVVDDVKGWHGIEGILFIKFGVC